MKKNYAMKRNNNLNYEYNKSSQIYNKFINKND